MIYLRWSCKLKISKYPEFSNEPTLAAKANAKARLKNAVFRQSAVQAPHLPLLKAKTLASEDGGAVDQGRGLSASKVQNALIHAALQVAIKDTIRAATIVEGGIPLAAIKITSVVQDNNNEIIRVNCLSSNNPEETTG